MVINLSQGHSEFSTPPRLVDLITTFINRGFNQYAPLFGVMSLRERIAEKVELLYGNIYNPDTEVTVTAGATQAIYTAIAALVREGDEVLIFEPAYNSYVPAIEVCGGRPVYVQLKEPDFHIDWREAQKLVNSKTRMIIINTPHNPTGSVLGSNDMKELQRIVRGTNIVVLSDEVYEHMVYSELVHESVARYPELACRSLIACSFGKTFNVTGWEVGYCLGPAKLMKEFRKVHQVQVYSVNAPIQYALSEFITYKEEYLLLADFYQRKRDHFQNLLSETRLIPMPVWGGVFQLVDFSQVSDDGDVTFARKLLHQYGIAALPMSLFHHERKTNHYLRFCFAKEESTLNQVGELLQKI